MESDKDRFGETMRLVERAKEDIYFAERDRELSHRIFQQLEKLRAQLQRVDKAKAETHCPKCHGTFESYTFQGIALDRCHECGGTWLDKGELEAIVKKISRGPLGAWLDKFAEKTEQVTNLFLKHHGTHL